MRVLLSSSNTDDVKFFNEVAKTAGLPVMHTTSVALTCVEFMQDPKSLIVVDVSNEKQYQEFEGTVAKEIGLFNEVLDSNKIFFVASKEMHELAFLSKSEIFGHFIGRKYDNPFKQRVFQLLKLASGEQKVFGIESYYPTPPKVQTIQVTKSAQKLAIVESLRNYLVKIGFNARIATGITTATDEILMNAIFDAPIDEAGKVVYLNTPRSANLDLTGRDVVELKIAYDGTTLGISVVDQYGSLDKKRLIGHIGKSYEQDAFKVKLSKAGAGLGLSNVFRNCGGLVFSCEIGMRTEVTLFYRKANSFKEFKEQPKFLSTFTYFS